MKNFLTRLLGLDRELRQRQIIIDNQRQQIEALKNSDQRTESRLKHHLNRQADLIGLLEDRDKQITDAVESIRKARRTLNLKHSTNSVRRQLDDALAHLAGGQP